MPKTRKYTDELVKLAKKLKPVAVPKDEDWAKWEAFLHGPLPPEFKVLVGAFGAGLFGDELTLYNPGKSGFISAHQEFHRVLKEGMAQPRAVFPEPGGFVVVASMGQEMIVLVPQETSWKVALYNHDLDSLKELDYTVPELLYRLYHKDHIPANLIAFSDRIWSVSRSNKFFVSRK